MGFSLKNNPLTKVITDRYTSSGGGLDLGNIAKDVGVAGALYSLINPNDSSGIAKFLGTGGQQPPVGYTGGIPNYTATRELVPNAFASTYTTPTGEIAPRRPGMAGRRYFTDTQFTQDTATPFMGITAEQIAAQNQAAIDDQALFESLLGGAATQRETTAAEQAAAQQAAAQQAAAQQAAAEQAAAAAADTFNTARDTNNTGITLAPTPTPYERLPGQTDLSYDFLSGLAERLAIENPAIAEFKANLLSPEESAAIAAATTGPLVPTLESLNVNVADGIDDTERKLVYDLLQRGFTTPLEVAEYYDIPLDVVNTAYGELQARNFAQGGNVNGYYLGGPTDGMADQIPATIDNMQPAALSDGEFVIPADVVSHLGNGNSDAGAQNLYSMMDRIRQDRTGTTKQGRQIDPNKYLA
jgi:hypothetical protein